MRGFPMFGLWRRPDRSVANDNGPNILRQRQACRAPEGAVRVLWIVADGRSASASEYARMGFRDRRDAGRQLAAQLLALAHEHPIVVALPRGGVPVGFEVASALGAPLDVLAVRKLGAPGNPEFGVGAIAKDGTAVLNAS